jgi:SAM-dependent methyltransferase
MRARRVGPEPGRPVPPDPAKLPAVTPPPDPPDQYLHGHAEPVLRSHRWRTAENSAAYLLGHLRPTDRLLDVGCGPGTITADLAGRVAHVTAVDRAADAVEAARAELAGEDVVVERADVHRLPFADGTFDVVHAHQVLQHLEDPVHALREMARVTRPGGLVAARDADYGAMTWAPEAPGITRWLDRYRAAARGLGAEPDAGRHLLGWCHRAGLQDVAASASVWCFADDGDRRWWADLWVDRILDTGLTDRLRGAGSDDDELAAMGEGWRRWADDPAGWFAVLHGEVLAVV